MANTKLYVGNLSYNTTVDQIRELFAQAGEITDVTIITDRDTGRSKGFGFVQMATVEGAQEAIKRFDGYTMDSRSLTVNEARPREERSGGGGYGGGGRGGGRGDRRDRDDYGGGGSRRSRF